MDPKNPSIINFAAEIKLPSNFPSECTPGGRPGGILITGTTGYLGPLLLMDALREYGDKDFYCVIRAKSDEEARKRLEQNLDSYSLRDLMIGFERVQCLAGDLAKPQFEMSDDVYGNLLEKVGVIFHAAADVSFMKTYEQLRDSTVAMTKNLLHFAMDGFSREFHYMSTIGVFDGVEDGSEACSGFQALECEIPPEVNPNRMVTAYFQSKWVSEQLVWAAASLGLDASIYRIGQIGAHTVSKMVNRTDALAGFVIACQILGVYPAVELKLPFVNADASTTIIRLSNLRAQDAEEAEGTRVFHLVGSEVGMSDFFKGKDEEVRPVSLEKWQDEFEKSVMAELKSEDDINAWLFLKMLKQAEETCAGNGRNLMKNISFSVAETLRATGNSFSKEIQPSLYAELLIKLPNSRSGSKVSGSRCVDKVEDAVEIFPVFDALPDELLQNVFMLVAKSDLVKRCRLVSRRWKNLSTEICRKRFVKVVNWESVEAEKKLEAFTVFAEDGQPPWSSYEGASDLLTFSFLEFYGKHIMALTLYGKQFEILLCLFQTPNLRRLDLDIRDWHWTPTTLPGKGRMDLNELKQLTIRELLDTNVELLNYLIVGCDVRLNYFQISSLYIREKKSAEIISSVLDHVSYCNVEVAKCILLPELTPTPGLKNFRIQDLEVILNEFDKKEGRSPVLTFDNAERFIASQAQHLKKLKLSVDITSSGRQSVPFHFPPLFPSLTSLSICLELRTLTSATFGNGFLSLLEPDQCPVLQEVNLKVREMWNYAEIRRNRNIRIEEIGLDAVYFPLNCHFDSVSKLKLDCLGRGEWNRVFPNLVCLEANIAYSDPYCVERCFSFTKLERLFLFFRAGPLTSFKPTSLLTGIPDPDAIYGRSEDEIRRMRGPSILQLENLMSLHIEFNGRDSILTDAAAELSLLQIQPLDLTIEISQMSEECEAKLRAHHRTFIRHEYTHDRY